MYYKIGGAQKCGKEETVATTTLEITLTMKGIGYLKYTLLLPILSCVVMPVIAL